MRKNQNKINNQMKGEGLLTIYIQICEKHFFLHFPKDKREYTSYLLEEKNHYFLYQRRGAVPSYI